MIINISQVVDVSHWNTNFVKVLAIGGGGGMGAFAVMILNYFTIINVAATAVSDHINFSTMVVEGVDTSSLEKLLPLAS